MSNIINEVKNVINPSEDIVKALHGQVLADSQAVKAEYLASNEAFMSFRTLILSAREVLANPAKAKLLAKDITDTFAVMSSELMTDIIMSLEPEKRLEVERLQGQIDNIQKVLHDEQLKLQALGDTGKAKAAIDKQQKVVDSLEAELSLPFETMKGLLRVEVDGKTRDFPNMAEKARIRVTILNNVRKAAYGGTKGKSKEKVKGKDWETVATAIKGCYSLNDLRKVSAELVPSELKPVITGKAESVPANPVSSKKGESLTALQLIQSLPDDPASLAESKIGHSDTLKSAVRLLGIVLKNDIPPSKVEASKKLQEAIDTLNQLIFEYAKTEVKAEPVKPEVVVKKA